MSTTEEENRVRFPAKDFTSSFGGDVSDAEIQRLIEKFSEDIAQTGPGTPGYFDFDQKWCVRAQGVVEDDIGPSVTVVTLNVASKTAEFEISLDNDELGLLFCGAAMLVTTAALPRIEDLIKAQYDLWFIAPTPSAAYAVVGFGHID